MPHPSSQNTRARAVRARGLSAADWLALLDSVAGGQVQLVVSTDDGARVALLPERDLLYLLDLQKAAAVHQGVPVVLTERERQVLVLIEDGASTAEVAERLDIAHGTAVQHLAAARRKYGVRTSAAAAAMAREAGALS